MSSQSNVVHRFRSGTPDTRSSHSASGHSRARAAHHRTTMWQWDVVTSQTDRTSLHRALPQRSRPWHKGPRETVQQQRHHMSKWCSACPVQGVGRGKMSQDHTKIGATIKPQQKQHLPERHEKSQKRYLPVQASGRLFCFLWQYKFQEDVKNFGGTGNTRVREAHHRREDG